jgi:hypothetical protein
LASVPSVSCPNFLWLCESESLLLPFPCLLGQPDITSFNGNINIFTTTVCPFPSRSYNFEFKNKFLI